MNFLSGLNDEIYKRQTSFAYKSNWQRIHLEPLLLFLLILLMGVGLVILYSATNESSSLLYKQLTRFSLALAAMAVLAQIPTHVYKSWAPLLFYGSCLLLISVLVMGKVGKGAQRWLDLGFIKFQPSELAKIAVPMMVAWYLSYHPLPPRKRSLLIAALIVFIPTLLIAKQPDLGTAIMIFIAGMSVILFAGISWKLVSFLLGSCLLASPLLWMVMHTYQKQRVLTFLSPESDPLGAGYHIIQSKIAIGSGGLFGKGYLNGSQAHLNYLPEHATDFIFAVGAEEFGLLGGIVMILLYILITTRTLLLANKQADSFARLLCASLGLTFFISAFVNMGMVMGLLPVVGIPLPIISYGGTALVTFMASFGIVMACYTHRKVL